MTDFSSEPEEKCFHSGNTKFDLKVTLIDQKKLAITLKDFEDQNIYSKEFTEDDYCKEIHRKMELADVYNAFAQSSPKADQGHPQKVKSQVDLQFGEIVECEKNPCFKVEKGGLVTVYMSVIENRTKKEVVYESKLALPLLEKINTCQQIRKLIQENNDQISKLTQQNKRLKEKLGPLKKQNAGKKFFKFICTPFLWLFSFLVVYIKAIFTENIQASKDKSHITKIMDLPQKNGITKIMNLPQKNGFYYKTNGARLRYDGNLQNRQYLFDQLINPSKVTKFKLKITRSILNNILIGIVDYEEQKDYQTSLGEYNAMGYQGKYGTKHPENIKEGDGFRPGDIVEVEVDRVSCTVKYFVNGALKASHSNKILDGNRLFVPYIEMYNEFDSVEYLMD